MLVEVRMPTPSRGHGTFSGGLIPGAGFSIMHPNSGPLREGEAGSLLFVIQEVVGCVRCPAFRAIHVEAESVT